MTNSHSYEQWCKNEPVQDQRLPTTSTNNKTYEGWPVFPAGTPLWIIEDAISANIGFYEQSKAKAQAQEAAKMKAIMEIIGKLGLEPYSPPAPPPPAPAPEPPIIVTVVPRKLNRNKI